MGISNKIKQTVNFMCFEKLKTLLMKILRHHQPDWAQIYAQM